MSATNKPVQKVEENQSSILSNILYRIATEALNFKMANDITNKTYRMNLLRYMKEQQCGKFVQEMQTLSQSIMDMINRDDDLQNDDYWKQRGVGVYWEQDEKFRSIVKDIHDKNSGTFMDLGMKKTGVSGLLQDYVRLEHINSLVGNAYWMTSQQKILFRCMLMNYFQNSPHLAPIYLNMDFSFTQRTRNSTNTSGHPVMQLLKSALAGSGPFILKCLQMVSNSNANSIKKAKDSEDWCAKIRRETMEKILGVQNHLDNVYHKSYVEQVTEYIKEKSKEMLLPNFTVQELTVEVFRNVPALEPEEKQLVLESMDFENEVKNIQDKILGSASIAQAHICTYNDQPALIKFVKPLNILYYMCEMNFFLTQVWTSIREYAEMEYQSTLSDTFQAVKLSDPQWAAQSPEELKNNADFQREVKRKQGFLPSSAILTKQCRQLTLFFLTEFAKEFDYESEFKNTKMGREKYHNKIPGVYSVECFKYKVNPFPYLLLEKIDGMTLDEMLTEKKEDQAFAKEVFDRLVKFFKVWLEVSLVDSPSFFHADVHRGNIMMNPQTKDMYIIDYGSCGSASEQISLNLAASMLEGMNFVDPFKKRTFVPKRKLRIMKQIWDKLDSTTEEGKIYRFLSLDLFKPQQKVDFIKFMLEEDLPKHRHLYRLVSNGNPTRKIPALTSIEYAKQFTPRSISWKHKPSVFRPWDFIIDGNPRYDPDFAPYHAHNIQVARKIALWVWQMCGATGNHGSSVKKDANDEDSFLNHVAEELLTYECELRPDLMALNVLKMSRDSGTCMNGQLLYFGRAIAYLNILLNGVQEICGQDCIRPQVGALLKEIFTTPGNMSKGAKYVYHYTFGLNDS